MFDTRFKTCFPYVNMFLHRPFIALSRLPTLNVNDMPVSIINKTEKMLLKNVTMNTLPLIDCFESETIFFIESEPVVKRHSLLHKKVSFVQLDNFYRDLRSHEDIKNLLFFRSWFRFKDDKLHFFNVLENINHPSVCTKSIAYMFRSSEKISYATEKDDLIKNLYQSEL